MSRRQSTPAAPRDAVLEPATVRPDYFGRTHPDPREDPPTVVLDPSGAPTEEIPVVGPETEHIPALGPTGPTAPVAEFDTVGIPVVAAEPGGTGPDGPARPLSALLGAAGALAGWLVAAHLLPVPVLGDAQLLVSVLLFVAGLAPLAMLPLRRLRPGFLVWLAPLLVVPPAAVAGLGGALLVPRITSAATAVDGPPVTGLLLVVLGCAACGVLACHDVLLAAAARPRWAVWRNALFVPVQIGALVALCGVAGLAAYGLVLSWVGAIAGFVLLGLVLVPVLVRRAPAPDDTGPSRMPAAMSLVGAALLHHLVPVVVTARFGPETGAPFFIAWQVFVVVDLAAVYSVHALSGAVARAPHRTTDLVARARKRLLVLFLPVIALGVALAGPFLTVFGAEYAEAGDLLRLLLLGLAFRLVVTHELGVRQALGHGMGFDRVQLFSAVLVLVVAIALPLTTVGVADLRLVAIGYIIVQVACAAAVLVIPAARRTDVEVRAP